jgi:hypothetical protein
MDDDPSAPTAQFQVQWAGATVSNVFPFRCEIIELRVTYSFTCIPAYSFVEYIYMLYTSTHVVVMPQLQRAIAQCK